MEHGEARTDRPWVSAPRAIHKGYQRTEQTVKTGGEWLDLYLAPEPVPDVPVVVFQHIKKTAGTSLLHLLYANYGEGEGEFRALVSPRTEIVEWHRFTYKALGSEGRERLVCAAGHTANLFLPIIKRPVQALTIVREPVDRVMSRYYFSRRRPDWTLEDLFVGAVGVRLHREIYFNGQARSLLEPHYPAAEVPFSGDDPMADLWRERLFDEVLPRYLVGLQERFDESVAVFAQALGWTSIIPARTRINADRPLPEELSAETREAIRRCNWLDEELHCRAGELLAVRCAALATTMGTSNPERTED